MDAALEEVSVCSPDGSVFGTLSWGELIEAAVKKNQAAGERAESRAMIPLALKIRYRAGGTLAGEGLTAEFGGGGFFLETSTPLPVGTELSVEFALPDQPQRRITTKGQVIRVRQKPERQVLLPGMEVRFLDLSEPDHQQVSALIAALDRTRLARR